nr:PREDICTED: methyltransferase-like protein 13 isoform X2 [Latimeria chalumnae]|eukprot:XP_014345432.1 PREDICTED: methyltransferase-like protein 13 isoform X2 [Latimeria chalumnae]
MYDVGYQDIINIDISKVVINQMKERNSTKRPKMAYVKMDMMQMEFEDSQFQVALDKGTLDAILTDESEKTLENVDRMFMEIGRVLQVGGRYICISLAQEHILKKAVGYFSQEGWVVRVHQITESEEAVAEKQFIMPIFVFVFTKFKKIPGANLKILEICADEQDKPIRLETSESLISAVKERQQYALLRNQLNKKTSSTRETVSLDLCEKSTSKPRYSLVVVDSPVGKPSPTNRFAIFIIPQGRETEWLFGTDEGRKQLAQSAGFRRLLVVSLHRDQDYAGMQSIQSELSGKVMELAPPGLPHNQQVPFLSMGGDIGIRIVQHSGTSQLSGDYVVEDVKGEDGKFFRRLVFLSNMNVVQSEARLIAPSPQKAQKKNKRSKRKQQQCLEEKSPCLKDLHVDQSYLCCEHHKVMIAGLTLLREVEAENQLSMLVVGLGGGSLPLFIHDYFRQTSIDAVEIDPSMLEVATQWFGFTQDERMKVHIADGLDYINSLAENGNCCYNVIMFDVDSKDLTLGMSCPPPAFVEETILQKVKRLLTPQGIFILNLVCRDCALKTRVIDTVKRIFSLVYLQKIEDEVNEILFCAVDAGLAAAGDELVSRARSVEQRLKKAGLPQDSTYCLSDMLKTMKSL